MKLLLIFSLTFSFLFCAPALSTKREFRQADGTTFKAKAIGNQYLNWFETDNGEVLKYNAVSKNFDYATIKENSLKASGTAYNKNSSKRARSMGHVNKINKEELYQLWNQKIQEAQKRKGFR